MGATACLLVSSAQPQDEALVRGLRSHDPELLDRLIEQYHYRLFRYLLYLTGNREAAEDLFQETWVRVIERGHQYDGRWKFEAWLFAIARHLTIDLLHRKKTLLGLDDLSEAGETKATPEPAAEEISPADFVSQRERAERIQAALNRLPAAHREVLVLRFQEDFALEEIAGVVSAPLSTVKSRLYRGLDELRDLLGGTPE